MGSAVSLTVIHSSSARAERGRLFVIGFPTHRDAHRRNLDDASGAIERAKSSVSMPGRSNVVSCSTTATATDTVSSGANGTPLLRVNRFMENVGQSWGELSAGVADSIDIDKRLGYARSIRPTNNCKRHGS